MNLDDLIANDSVTPEGAEILRDVARSGESFLVHALPRDAGKTTLVQAILAEAPPDISRDEYLGSAEEFAALSQAPTPGYLLVAEIGHRGRPGYLAQEEVPPIFELVAGGYSLVSSLHADSVEEVFEVLAANGVPTSVAATVPYLIKIRMIKNDAGTHVRRVVDEIHKINADGGDPSATLLYRWDGTPPAATDSWVEAPDHSHHGRRSR